jgi:predicted amidohydrolase YtcJ
MSQARGFAVQGVLTAVLLALVAGFMLSNKAGPSRLYCVSNPASSFVTTLNASLPHAQCFRVQDGIFTEILAEEPWSRSEEITYLDGFVLPGIIESHGHILQYGEMLESVSLYEAESVEEIRTRIKQFLKIHQGEGYGARNKWIRGIGWDQKYFGGVMPTAVCLPSLHRILFPMAVTHSYVEGARR